MGTDHFELDLVFTTPLGKVQPESSVQIPFRVRSTLSSGACACFESDHVFH